jgi:hypothetical protein
MGKANITLEKIIKDKRVWGNPNAEIGFVLIEPADGYKEWLEQTSDWKKWLKDNPPKKWENHTCKIATESVQEISGNKNAYHGKESFHRNLFSLNCPSTASWPREYEKALRMSKNEYRKRCRAERFPWLYDNLKKHKNLKIIICCGETYWPDFLNLFKLDTKYNKAKKHLMFDIKLDAKPIKLFLVPFLNYRRGIRPIIKDIAQKLKKG